MNTTYFLNCVAGNVFGTKSEPAIPTTYYIGLSTTAPNINGTGVDEPSTDAGYARVQLTNMSEPLDGVVTNELAINFNESTASWGTITHFVIYDSPTVDSGNLQIHQDLFDNQGVHNMSSTFHRYAGQALSLFEPLQTYTVCNFRYNSQVSVYGLRSVHHDTVWSKR